MTEGVEFPIHRNAVAMRISEEMVAIEFGFHRLGHHEPVTPSPEDVAAHTRAVELVAEMDANPFIRMSGYDSDVEVEPLETERWVADESHEEWMARWRAHRAAHRDEKPPMSALDRMMLGAFSSLVKPSPLLRLYDTPGEPPAAGVAKSSEI